MIWGDDQHENFTEDIIPPFCVLAYDADRGAHRAREGGPPNVWGEAADTAFKIPGHREAGKYLARQLLEQGVDMAYAYKPLAPSRASRTRSSTRSSSSTTTGSASPTPCSRSR